RVVGRGEGALGERGPGLIGRLWAGREGAYKHGAGAERALRFAHRRFRVDAARGVVEHEGRSVRVAWSDGPGWVGCCAWSGATPPRVVVEEGTDVRSLARRLLVPLIGDFEIVRPGGGAPEVWRRGAPVPGVAVSLSHDGRFVGCAAVPS